MNKTTKKSGHLSFSYLKCIFAFELKTKEYNRRTTTTHLTCLTISITFSGDFWYRMQISFTGICSDLSVKFLMNKNK